MSLTPAAQLARLKVTYPRWWIRRGLVGYLATHRVTGRRLSAPTLGELAYALEFQGE